MRLYLTRDRCCAVQIYTGNSMTLVSDLVHSMCHRHVHEPLQQGEEISSTELYQARRLQLSHSSHQL